VQLKLGHPGKALRGGARTLAVWRQLLGLDQLADGDRRLSLSRAEICFSDGHIELSLQGDRLDRLAVRLLPCRRPEQPLGVYVALGGAVPSEAVRRLLGYIHSRLQPARYETLLKIFRRDPDAVVVAAAPSQAGAAGIEELFERSVVRTHGGSAAWRVFFAELEQRRNFNHHLGGDILLLKHEDLECSYATPPIADGTVSFFSYSCSHLSRRPSPPPAAEPAQPPAPRRQLRRDVIGTDLTERDVIGGAAGKVGRVLDAVAELSVKPDAVIVKTSCVPKVIGDDLAGAIARFEERTGLPTVFVDNLADEDDDPFSALLDKLSRKPAQIPPDQQVKRRINLVGFPHSPEMDRLVGLLEKLGVIINTRLIPEVRLEDIERYPQAELQVLLDSKLYRPSFERIIGNVDMRSLYPTPPYGVTGCRRWATEVAAAVGIADDIETLWEAEWAPLRAEWVALTARAAAQRLGFVLDRRAAELLLDPTESAGVPLMAMLQEMGFQLELLLYHDVPEDIALPGDKQRFAGADELADLLRRSTAAAFYSELFFDRRLSRSGKAQVSASDFRLGLGGALETLRRLLAVCELPFYRRYGQHLGEPFG